MGSNKLDFKTAVFQFCYAEDVFPVPRIQHLLRYHAALFNHFDLGCNKVLINALLFAFGNLI